MKYTAIINDQTYEIEVGANNTVIVNGEPHNVDFRTIDGGALYSLLLDNSEERRDRILAPKPKSIGATWAKC